MKKIKNNLVYASLGAILLIPRVSFALTGVRNLLTEIKNSILPDVRTIVVWLAFIYFFWGVGQFILHSDDQKAREEGKQKMIWGVIALFVIVGVWGLVRLLAYTLNVGLGGSVPNPDFTGGRSGGGVPIVPVP